MITTDITRFGIDILSQMLLDLEGIYFWEYSPELYLLKTNCPYPEFWANYFHRSTSAAFLLQHISDNPSSEILPIILSDAENIVWCAVPVIHETSLTGIYMIGPFLSSNVDLPTLAKKITSISRHSGSVFENVLQYLQETPVVAITNIFTYGIQLNYLMTHKKCPVHDFIMQPSVPYQKQIAPESDLPEPDIEANNTKHDSIAFERLYMKLIREGNLEYKSYLTQYNQIGRIGTMAQGDPLRQAKNEGIASCVITRHAAIEGGMEHELALTLADYYIQSIEDAKSITDVYMRIGAMQDDYIHRVHAIRDRNSCYSDKVSRCLEYIDYHITEKITLETISDALGYSAYYLSALFKKETGQSPASYIKQKRIEYAKEQLQYSSLDIATISEKLYFASPSHFGKIFKELTGETPGEYRKRLYHP